MYFGIVIRGSGPGPSGQGLASIVGLWNTAGKLLPADQQFEVKEVQFFRHDGDGIELVPVEIGEAHPVVAAAFFKGRGEDYPASGALATAENPPEHEVSNAVPDPTSPEPEGYGPPPIDHPPGVFTPTVVYHEKLSPEEKEK